MPTECLDAGRVAASPRRIELSCLSTATCATWPRCRLGGDDGVATEAPRRLLQSAAQPPGALKGALPHRKHVFPVLVPFSSQAWAVMESRLGHHAAARKVFEAGSRCAPPHAPLLSAWARMEVPLVVHQSITVKCTPHTNAGERFQVCAPTCAGIAPSPEMAMASQ